MGWYARPGTTGLNDRLNGSLRGIGEMSEAMIISLEPSMAHQKRLLANSAILMAGSFRPKFSIPRKPRLEPRASQGSRGYPPHSLGKPIEWKLSEYPGRQSGRE